jgi:hypothetical protein
MTVNNKVANSTAEKHHKITKSMYSSENLRGPWSFWWSGGRGRQTHKRRVCGSIGKWDVWGSLGCGHYLTECQLGTNYEEPYGVADPPGTTPLPQSP